MYLNIMTYPITARPNSDLQQATLDYLGPNLHCAMQSRKAELEYLRRLVEQMFPFILNPQGLKSRYVSRFNI